MNQTRDRVAMVSMFVVVIANYVAQIPYYLRLYYFPHHTPPALAGSLALGATLAWFLIGFTLLWRGRAAGYWLTLLFLITETGFYDFNTIGLLIHGYPLFFQLANPDPTLRAVFAIGDLNMFAGLVFIALLLVWRQSLATSARGAIVASARV